MGDLAAIIPHSSDAALQAQYADVLSNIWQQRQQRVAADQAQQDAKLLPLIQGLHAVDSDPVERARRWNTLAPAVQATLVAKDPTLKFGSYQTPQQLESATRAKAMTADMTGGQPQGGPSPAPAPTPAPAPQAAPPSSYSDAMMAPQNAAGPRIQTPAPSGNGPTQNGQPNAPSGPDPTALAFGLAKQYRAVHGADMPKDQFDAILQNAALGPDGVKQAILIATKQAPTYQDTHLTADQAATQGRADKVLTDVTMPNAQSTRTLQGAQTSEAQARVPLIGAQTKEALARAANPGTGGVGGINVGDAKAVADAIMSGKQPPVMTGLYRNSLAVKAELARNGYNLTAATQDWAAAQTWLKSANSTQQIRIHQAINFTYDSLSVIDELAKQWDGSGYPALNKGRLIAAKQGLLGKDAQSLANKLDAQINDTVAEMGYVYMGGNSPTDHSMQLASKNLSSNWSKESLLSNADLIRRNLQIRANSLAVPVAGNANNQYAPPGSRPDIADRGGVSGEPKITTTPDGLRWQQNPDGSMTQVQ